MGALPREEKQASLEGVGECRLDGLLCSRNARPQKALVGRAQWKINQPPSLKRERASLEGTRGRSMRALEGRVDYLMKRKVSGSGWFDDLWE